MTSPDAYRDDEQQIQNAVLALLGVFEFNTGRARKRYDIAVMESLQVQRLIFNPRGHGESGRQTDEEVSRVKALAVELFGTKLIR
ncbi:DUF6429 family protein [Paucibacter sp. B51]|uniref:DUF6429 family protein n=1 Tax=Paucibacter sp. B51 TaxID=2993315 RepID=UPI003FA7C53E